MPRSYHLHGCALKDMAKLPPNNVFDSANLDGDQIVKGLAVDNSYAYSRSQSKRGDVAEPFRLALVDPTDFNCLANRNFRQRVAGQLVNGPVSRRYGIAVGIYRRIAQRR